MWFNSLPGGLDVYWLDIEYTCNAYSGTSRTATVADKRFEVSVGEDDRQSRRAYRNTELHPVQEGHVVARNTSAGSTQERAGTRERSPGRRTNAPLERVTVNLSARSAHALDQAVELTGDSKTDAINRSLQVYAFIEQVLHGDGAVYVRESSDGELERLRLF